MKGGITDGQPSEYELAQRRLQEIHRKLAPLSEPASPAIQSMSETSGDDVDAMMGVLSNMAGASLQDIDRLIGDLSVLRDRLKVDGERIQQEIADYLRLSKVAMESTQIIAEHLAQRKQHVG